MKSSIGEILKKCRLNSERSVKQISDILVSKGFKASEKTIYSWENGNSQPTPDAFLLMCKLYNVTDILKTFGYADTSATDISSPEDYEYIKKYRELDDHGKDMVDTVLQKEFDRIVVQDAEPKDNIFTVNTDDMGSKASAADAYVDDGSSNIIDVIHDTDDIVEDEYPAPNAANDRKATSKQKAHADNIMKNDSEWI